MSLGPQSKNCGKIFGDLRLYNEIDEQWVYVKPPTVGDIKYSIVEKDHAGWLICDGRSLSRADYPELFELIGVKYGSASSDTFNLPDCRGRVLGSIGSGSGLTARSAGTLIGSETHTMTVAQMPTHTHSLTDPGHTHTVSNTVNFTGDGTPGSIDNSGGEIDTNTTFTTTSSSSTTGITAVTTGNSQPFNIMQPTAFLGHVFLFSKI
jgi:microcystin-dependent protein